jgi:hypothetical protein
MKAKKKNQYCCVADLILSASESKKIAMRTLSLIWNKRHKEKL